MSCAASSDFCIYSGDDLRVIVDVYDQNGALVNISGALSITWSLSNSPNGIAIVTKTLGAGISIASPTSFVFDIVPANTATIQGSYYQEAEVVTSAGKTYTVLSGRVTIKPTLI